MIDEDAGVGDEVAKSNGVDAKRVESALEHPLTPSKSNVSSSILKSLRIHARSGKWMGSSGTRFGSGVVEWLKYDNADMLLAFVNCEIVRVRR